MLEELYGELKDTSKATMLFQMLKPKIHKISYTDDDLAEAHSLDPDNRNDALHALLAKKAGADFVVTRNIKHFNKFSGIIKSKFPEDV